MSLQVAADLPSKEEKDEEKKKKKKDKEKKRAKKEQNWKIDLDDVPRKPKRVYKTAQEIREEAEVSEHFMRNNSREIFVQEMLPEDWRENTRLYRKSERKLRREIQVRDSGEETFMQMGLPEARRDSRRLHVESPRELRWVILVRNSSKETYMQIMLPEAQRKFETLKRKS